jgi:hypothetical protein
LEDDRAEAKRRPEAGQAEARRQEADREERRVHVMYQTVQDMLGPKPGEGQGQTPDRRETGLRPDYVIPKWDVPERPTIRPPPWTLPSS